MHSKSMISSQSVLRVLVVAVAAVVAVGAADAQIVILENDEIILEDLIDGQTARLYFGGDLYLGGNGWTGEIYQRTPAGLQSGSWVTSTLTLGALGDDGDIFLKDSINNSTTVQIDGQFAQIILGNSASTEDGDISVLDNDGTSSIFMDGASGNVTNQYNGNGLVKGWAEINANGTVASCWRCNTNALETRTLGTGTYEVDFNFNTTVATRPRSALLDTHTTGSAIGMIGLADRAGDATSVYVQTYNAAGAAANQPFTIVIY